MSLHYYGAESDSGHSSLERKRLERRTALLVSMSMVTIAAMQVMSGNLLQEKGVMDWLQVVLQFVGVALCFAIAMQGWMIFQHTLSRHRLYMAALFVAIAMLELMHALTYPGMPGFMGEPNLAKSYSFMLAARLTEALCLGVIFLGRDIQAPLRQRNMLFFLAAVYGLALIGGVVLWHGHEGAPAVLESVAGAGWFHVAAIAGMLLYLASIGLVLYRYRLDKPPVILMIVQGIFFLFVSLLAVYLSVYSTGIQFLLGQGLKVVGLYFLLNGVYQATIEEPYRRQRRAEEYVNYVAMHDELTGLPNRKQIRERLGFSLEEAGRRGSKLAVLFLDIDRFNKINDSLGHTFGDRMLQAIAERLTRGLQNEAAVYRVGGDEFMVQVTGLGSGQDAEDSAQELVNQFEEPLVVEGIEYHVTISVGVAIFPDHGEDVEELVKNANTAMYLAKKDSNDYQVYVPRMNFQAYDKLLLENDLRKALERNEFQLYYQPKMNIRTREITGVEALLRWNHPERGLVPPGEFISMAEESGLIVPIGEWTLRTACMQAKAWHKAGFKPMRMSVNLSMKQFHKHGLIEVIADALSESGLDPKYLELEITESMTMDVEYAADKLDRLKRLGVLISIDDFGTGYSSLSYLKKFPIDRLKIDRSFVSDMLTDVNDAAIVSTISAMARHLKLKVIAEGVETEEQIFFLKRHQCDEAQGYYISRPQPEEALRPLLEQYFRSRKLHVE